MVLSLSSYSILDILLIGGYIVLGYVFALLLTLLMLFANLGLN
jgi:hypothetical protein